LIAALILGAVMGAAPPVLDGIAIGENLAIVIHRRDFPNNREAPTIVNADAGHIWSWTEKDGTLERLTTNDDGDVQLIEILASSKNDQWISVPVVGSLQFNSSGHINAQPGPPQDDLFRDEWLPLPKVAGTVVGYAIAPNYGVVFGFPAPGDEGLIEVATGTRDALFTTGLIPSDVTTPLRPATVSHDIYKAAKLTGMPPCGGFVKNLVVFVRVAVRADGTPSAATVFYGTGYLNEDNRALYCPMHETFQPATLNGNPVPSVYFQKQIV
jgi:hypothetical protein